MKTFLKKSAYFVFATFLMLIVIELLLRQIPNDYSYKKNYLEKNSNTIKVLFLGNSHAYFGINPELITDPSFNAAHFSQSLDYDFKILKQFEHHMDSLKAIVLPIDYFSLYKNLETGVEKWRVKNYVIYYGFEGNASPYNYLELMNGAVQDQINRLIKYYYNKKTDVNCNTLGWGKTYQSINSKNLVTTGATAAKRHKAKSDKAFQYNLQNLNNIVAFAEKHHCKVLLYGSPAYETYIKLLDTAQLNKTISAVTELSNQHKSVRYYNLINDPSFKNSDFYDADHLNEIGAKKLTQKIDSLIHLN
jgi:hypothetical protein